MDIFTKQKRSEVMSRIGQKNTKPEIAVRKLLHRLGYRFRLHGKQLSGKPDVYLTKYQTAIFIHGCFWHGHNVCKHGQLPKSNTEYWSAKIKRNRQRDNKNRGCTR